MASSTPIHAPARQLMPYALVVAAPVLLFAPFLLGQLMFYWGTPLLQFAPWRAAALLAVRAGAWPLWNPWLGNGAPLLANYQSALLYPPNWLSLIAPLDWSLNGLLIAHIVWTGLGQVTLARSLGYRPLGQTVAGLAFGLSQYVVARAGFYSINAALAWLPWIIWAGDRLWTTPAGAWPRTVRNAVLLAGCVSLQLLAGHAQTTWYTLLLLGAWLLVRWRAARPSRLAWLLLPAALLTAGLVAAAQLLPTAELLRQSPRAEAAGYDFVMTYSFSPWRLLTWLAPDLLGNPARGRFYGYGNYLEDAVYLGLLPLLLAAGVLARLLRRRASEPTPDFIFFLAGLLPVTVLLALGRNTPVFPFLYRFVPTFNLFQAPTRFMVWAVFALALLGGWGADRWAAPQGRALYWTRLGAAGALSLCATCLLTFLGVPSSAPLAPQIYTVAAALLTMGVNLLAFAGLALLKPAGLSARWDWAVALCLTLDLIYASLGINPGAPANLYNAPTATGPALVRALAGHRLYQFPDDEYAVKFNPYFSFFSYGQPRSLAVAARAAQLPNVGVLDGVASASNFDPLVSARYAAFIEVISQTRSLRLLQLMDVGALVSSTPLPWPVITRAPAVTFYQAPLPPLRAWPVYASEVAADMAAAQTAIARPDFDPRAAVILEAAAPGEPLTADPPPAASPGDPNQLRVSLTLDRPGWVIVADTYYPGWRAWVDGQPAALRPADLAFRAVAVPAGAHTLVFQYDPVGFRWGLGLSGLGLGLCLAGLIAARLGNRST